MSGKMYQGLAMAALAGGLVVMGLVRIADGAWLTATTNAILAIGCGVCAILTGRASLNQGGDHDR